MIGGLTLLVGGVCLLLWGAGTIRTTVSKRFGARIKSFLCNGNTMQLRALATGALVAIFLQSSTATTLMVSGFIANRVMTVGVGIVAVLGGDIGSALSALVIASKPEWFWALLVISGFAALAWSSRPSGQDVGRILMAAGILVLALSIISGVAFELEQSPELSAVLSLLGGYPLLSVLLGGVLAWLAHSGLATVLFVAALVQSGTLGLEAGTYLLLGANVGSAIPPVLATSRAQLDARAPALANGLLRLLMCVAATSAVSAWGLDSWFPAFDLGLRLLLLHLGVNMVLASFGMPFAPLMERGVTKALAARAPGGVDGQPKYLPETKDVPAAVTLAAVGRETLRMCDVFEEMLSKTLDALRAPDEEALRAIRKRDDVLDSLHEAVKLHASESAGVHAGRDEGLARVIAFSTAIEHSGDITVKNLLRSARKLGRERIRFSDEGYRELRNLGSSIEELLQLATSSLMYSDRDLELRIIECARSFDLAAREAIDNHFRRLNSRLSETMWTSSLHLDVVRDLRHIFTLVTTALGIVETTYGLPNSNGTANSA